ncbi:MAG TPA: hypothetical protein VD966_05225, partial [Pyrinomonadaceae bacterium]|nr:hypothetical protein [Pyrinomonadaceae bacterium]
RRSMSWPIFLAGVLVGCCTLVKPFYAAFLLVPLTHLIAHREVARGRISLLLILGLVAFLLPLALTLGWFAVNGALDELIEVHLIYTTQVYSGVTSSSIGSRVSGVIEFLWRGKVMAVSIPAIMVGWAILWRQRQPVLWVVAAWTLAALFCVVLQNKFFPYHWHPILPPLALLGGIGFHALLRQAPDGAPSSSVLVLRLFAWASLAVVLFHASIRPVHYAVDWLGFISGQKSEQEYYSHFFDGGLVKPVEDIQAAAYIRTRTEEKDRIAIWGYDAGITYLAGRTTASRLGGWLWPVVAGDGTPFREKYRREYIQSSHAEPPTYFVVKGPLEDSETGESLRRFPELHSFLGQNYTLEMKFGSLNLYRHNPYSREATKNDGHDVNSRAQP